MYKRVLLKLSGESLMGEQSYGLDNKRLEEYAHQIKKFVSWVYKLVSSSEVEISFVD